MTTTVTDHAPFRADQVGSLLRPPELKAAREQRAKSEISEAELRAVEDKLIRTAAKMQESVGLQAITDGDFRRQSWSSDFLCAIGGVVQAPPSGPRQREEVPVGSIVRDWQPPTPKVVGKLEWSAGGIARKAFVAQGHHEPYPQSHHPFAEHVAFSWWARRRRQGGLSGHGAVSRT